MDRDGLLTEGLFLVFKPDLKFNDSSFFALD